MAKALLQEAAVWAEAAALTGSPLWKGEGFPPGRGRPVVLVPGFFSPERGLLPLAKALRRAGWDAAIVPTGLNVGCAEEGASKVVVAVEEAVATSGLSTVVIGHSRGGQLALAAAARRPEHVGLVVTLGTPSTGVGLPTLGFVGLATRGLAMVGRIGRLRLASLDCGEGPCCERMRADLARSRPAGIVHAALVATRDGFVPAVSTSFPDAEQVDVPTGHLGLALSIPGWTAVAEALTWV